MRTTRYAYWNEVAEKYKCSGLTLRDFCIKYDYVFETFKYWLYRRLDNFECGIAKTQDCINMTTPEIKYSPTYNTIACNNLIIDNSYHHIYLVTSLKTTQFSIDYFVNYAKQILKLNPFSIDSLFIFKGASNKSIKLMSYDGNCFNIYRKILAKGTFKWSKENALFHEISLQQFKWLVEGLKLNPKRANYITNFI